MQLLDLLHKFRSNTAGISDQLTARTAPASAQQAGFGLTGRLTIKDADGNVLHEGENKICRAGMAVIVDAFQSASALNTFKYISFGTNSTTATSAQTSLLAECSGGTYARLIATQKEGANARVYRMSGTWTNNCGSQQVVREWGVHNASTAGVMLARYATTGTGVCTVQNSGVLYVQYDITVAAG